MPKSMTGFGRFSLSTKEGQFVAEIQSINRKFLEISLLIPKEFFRFEIDMRKWIKSKILRGQVTLRLNYYPEEKSIASFLPELSLLQQIQQEWQKRTKALKIDEKTIDLHFLVQQLRNIPFAEKIEEKPLKKNLEQVIQKAISALLEMKKREGKALINDITKRMKTIESLVTRIKKKSLATVPKYRKSLIEKLSEYFEKDLSKEDRIVQEIVLFAEKVDITEEIIRLRSHITQWYRIIKEETAIGRKLEFLIQEMYREMHTIGSKALESVISSDVVEMKTELEKIREQVQNIE